MKIKGFDRSKFILVVVVLSVLMISCSKLKIQVNEDTMLFSESVKTNIKGNPIVVDNSKIRKRCGEVGGKETVSGDFNGDGIKDIAGIYIEVADEISGKLQRKEYFAIVLNKTNGDNKMLSFPIGEYDLENFDSSDIISEHYLVPMNTDHTNIMTKNTAANNSTSLFVSSCKGGSVLYYFNKSGNIRHTVVDERTGDVE